VKQFAPLVFGVVVASVAFALMWRKGYFLKISNYVQETKEELRKCSWPTREELIESTAVVMVAIFTVGADFIISLFVHLIA